MLVLSPDAVYSPVYFKHLNLRTFSEQILLIFKWVEHKCFDVVSNSSKIIPTPTSSENSREISKPSYSFIHIFMVISLPQSNQISVSSNVQTIKFEMFSVAPHFTVVSRASPL